MAKRPAQLLVAPLRRSTMMGLPRSSGACCRRLRAARRQISNDRISGDGWSARLKRRPRRQDKSETEITEMLDRSGCERRGQQRRIRQEGRRSELDGRADRAIVVSVAGRMLGCALLRRGRLRRRNAGYDRVGRELFEMDVSERQDKLQRHCCKREPTSAPPIGTNPTHWQTRQPPLGTVYSGAHPGQCFQYKKSPVAHELAGL